MTMHCLIRTISQRTATGVTYSDKRIDTDELHIGRGTDQHVQLGDLRVALAHAVIRPIRGQRIAIHALAASGLWVNDRLCQTATLEPGDRIRIGRTALRVEQPAADSSLTLVVEGEIEADSTRERPPVSLQQTRLRKAPWSWLLFFTILGFGLAIPLFQIHTAPEPPQATITAGPVDDGRGDLRIYGADLLWDSGALSGPHKNMGEACGVCHQKPFERVPDSSCTGCHVDQADHVEDHALIHEAGLDEIRCASCHREHDGDEHLIASDARQCTDCHMNPDSYMPSSGLERVGEFDRHHPGFRVQVTRLTDHGEHVQQRERLADQPEEESGLLFPHDVHMDPDGMQTPSGRQTLACADCHTPEPGGAGMKPVTMEQHCADCHRLDFEPADPERTVPHGDADAVMTHLFEYYATRALTGGFSPDTDGEPAPDIVRQSRRPDRVLSPPEQASALSWAQAHAQRVGAELFEYRSCTTCHEVERSDASPAGWHVMPVHVTDRWFVAADFTHARHDGMACADCHAAEDSADAGDVLIPDIDNCLQCHGGSQAQDRVPSTCIDCHGFHEARLPGINDIGLDAAIDASLHALGDLHE